MRFYERAGLLPKPARTAANYRLYPEEVVTRIRFIRRAQQLGFTLKEIKDLLELRVSRRSSCAQVRSHAQSKIADIERRILSPSPWLKRSTKARWTVWLSGCAARERNQQRTSYE
jgi:DNA-binding transcriptional MerR regulator